MSTYQTGGIRRDDFVAAVRPNPKSTVELIMLQGYVGDSDLEGHVRLYSDAELTEFIDLREADISHSETVSTDEDPLGGSRVWIQKNKQFVAGDPNLANRIKSTFLDGDIARAFKDLGETAFLPSFQSRIVCQTWNSPLCGGPRTLNPINCPRITIAGPLCPAITIAGPRCNLTIQVQHCPSVICITKNQRFCEVACFGGTKKFDPTIWQHDPIDIFQQVEVLKNQLADLTDQLGKYSPYGR